MSKNVQESRLKWYGHILRREDEYVCKRVMGMEVAGKRRRGITKRRWLDSIRDDVTEGKLSGEDAQLRLNGGVSQHTLTPHKSRKTMRKKKKKKKKKKKTVNSLYIVVSAIAVFRLVDNILSSSLHC